MRTPNGPFAGPPPQGRYGWRPETEMDYGLALDTALNRLHDEGRYRTFIDIERRRGA